MKINIIAQAKQMIPHIIGRMQVPTVFSKDKPNSRLANATKHRTHETSLPLDGKVPRMILETEIAKQTRLDLATRWEI